MDRDLAKRVNARRNSILARIGERLAAEPQTDLRDELQELEAWSKMQASLPASLSGRLYWPAFIALLTVTIVGLAWSMPRPTTRVVLDATVDGLSFQTSAAWVWPEMPPVSDSSVRIREADWLELPGAGRRIESDVGSAWATIDGGRFKLAGLTIGGGSTVILENPTDSVYRIFVGDGEVSGKLAVWSTFTAKAGPTAGETAVDTVFNAPVPETVAFEGGRRTVKTDIQLPIAAATDLSAVPVRRLGLVREIVPRPGLTDLVSTMREGHLRLPDAGVEITLAAGDRLTLSKMTGTISRLHLADHIRLSFEGDAERVSVGPAGFERDLTPSWLDWLYHNQKLPFLWSALSIVAGLLWSGRRLLGS